MLAGDALPPELKIPVIHGRSPTANGRHLIDSGQSGSGSLHVA